MGSITVRMSKDARKTLEALAKREGLPMQTVLDKAIEEYRRNRVLEETNEAYGRLRDDSKAWEEEREERELWATTLADGQEDE